MEDIKKLTYDQIHSLVMQMPLYEKEQLRRDLNRIYEESRDNSRPYTIEEVRGFVSEAEEDIEAGRFCTAEEGRRKIEEKFPWLKE